MDPISLLFGAAFALGFASDQEPQDGFYGCEVELVEGTNYYNFVDPTCASAVTTNTTDYELVEVLDDKGRPTGDFVSVPTNNK